MSIDLKTIKHISKLSRISVDEKKAEKLASDLNSIFDFIEKLNELKTENVEPLTSVQSLLFKLLCHLNNATLSLSFALNNVKLEFNR